MASRSSDQHRAAVLRQFGAQAARYAAAAPVRNERALELLLAACRVRAEDRVLDVACGPGLVACAIAAAAREVEGVDATAAMIEQARALAAARRLENVAWSVAAIPPLPWEDLAFDLVLSRYAFHHFEEPGAVLAEMARVCRPGGRVVVCDVAPVEEKAAAFNAVERLRDSSHAGALPVRVLLELFEHAGLRVEEVGGYALEGELESLLARSFPEDGGAEEVRRRFEASLADDSLGVGAWRDGQAIRYTFPIALVVGVNPQ